MIRFFIISTLLLLTSITRSQTVVSATLTPEEVTNFVNSLKDKPDDPGKVEMLLQLARYYFRKEGNEKSSIDSAELFIKDAREISFNHLRLKDEGVMSLYESSLEIRKGNINVGKQLANKAIVQLRSVNDGFNVVMAYLELCRCYDPNISDQAIELKNALDTLFQQVLFISDRKKQDACMLELVTFYVLYLSDKSPSLKLDFLSRLSETYRKINDRVNEFWARKEMADIHYQQGQLSQAINELLQIAKEQKAGNYDRICFTYDLLAGLHMAASNYDEALYYSLETIKNVRTNLDSMFLPVFYSRIAAVYSETGSISEAVEWNLKRLSYLNSIKDIDHLYAIMHRITGDLIKLGEPERALKMILEKSKNVTPVGNAEKALKLLTLAKCYTATGQNAIAEKYCEELINLIELRIHRKEITSDPMSYEFLSSFYLTVGQYEKAEKYFNSALEARSSSEGNYYKNWFLFRLDSSRGNYLSAIRHLQAMHLETDSIFTAAKSKQIEELKATYETDQKNQNIQFLTNQDKLQKSKLRQGTILRNIIFAVVGLLIIIMALLYNRYRIKQRTNRKLESHQREIAQQNSSLQHLLHEKEWLLKEIHHRVKNNLQIVMSLLNSQSAFIQNDAALTAIHDSQHRVHAMSLIHQKLYGGENVSSIDMSSYIRELVSYLTDSFSTGQRIRCEFNIQHLHLDVSQAVPVGLILNEAVTNAIKYAFPDNRPGIIAISLFNRTSEQDVLIIADNGVGMPSSSKKVGSLGMSLMQGLSEDLEGELSIESNSISGTTITISFLHDQGPKRSVTSAPLFGSNN